MKITLIRPAMYQGQGGHDALPSLAMAVLAGLTPPEIETVFYDDRKEAIPYEEATDLVGITVETYTARRAYAIAGKFRERGVPVVLGGYHPSFMPEESLRFADAVVIGDAEGVWERVLEDARSGTLQRIYQSNPQSLTRVRYDRSIFAGKHYVPIHPVQFSRGCRFACDFCSIHAFYGSNVRHRPIREVVEEIETLPRGEIFFVDDNLFVDRESTAALLRELLPLNIRWSCQVSIDITGDRELMDLMQKSGCTSALIGFESLNADNLVRMKKKWNLKQRSYQEAIQQFYQRGIMLTGTFIFGYDHDTTAAFEPTVEFAIENKFLLANFNPLTPMPGSQLYQRFKAEQRLLYEPWWLHPNYRYGEATYRPRGMSPRELTEGCFEARRKFAGLGSMARRLANPRANLRSAHSMGVFLLTNFISRREIHRKQGRLLGEALTSSQQSQIALENS